MGPDGDAGMERKSSHLANGIYEWIIWPAVRQGLQREYLAALLWAHGNAVSNGTAEQMVHGCRDVQVPGFGTQFIGSIPKFFSAQTSNDRLRSISGWANLQLRSVV